MVSALQNNANENKKGEIIMNHYKNLIKELKTNIQEISKTFKSKLRERIRDVDEITNFKEQIEELFTKYSELDEIFNVVDNTFKEVKGDFKNTTKKIQQFVSKLNEAEILQYEKNILKKLVLCTSINNKMI